MNKYIKLFTLTKNEKEMVGVAVACSLGLTVVGFIGGAAAGILGRINN